MTGRPLNFTPRAAIYAHTASKREKIDHQINACQAFAASLAWHFAGVYADRDTPNLRTDRLELIRLTQDAAAGEFDVVLCQDIYRITPNLWLQRDMLVRLCETGLEAWSVEEGSLEELRLEYQHDLPLLDGPLGPFRRRDDQT